MAYSEQTVHVTVVSNVYQFSSTTVWSGGTTYVNAGQIIPTASNGSGVYEIILKVSENPGGQNSPVEHAFSLESMGVVPPADATIEIIVLEGSTEHGRHTTTLTTASNPVYVTTGSDEPKRPIKIPSTSNPGDKTAGADEPRRPIKIPSKPGDKTAGADEPKRPIIIPSENKPNEKVDDSKERNRSIQIPPAN